MGVSHGQQKNTIDLANVFRRFGETQALDNLSLQVPEGKITVLLGPNGAGKTTAIRMITGALTPDTGTINVFGLDPKTNGQQVRRRCGIVSAKPALYDRLTGWDNLLYASQLYKVASKPEIRIKEAAGRFGIEHALDQQVGGYSTGMKTRLALAPSVLHEPELLLFDEPTSGLDPESAAAVLNLIRDMTSNGATVLMCTHHLVEAEGLADSVVMLEAGTDLVSGTPDVLTSRYWPEKTVLIEATGDTAKLHDAPGVLKVTEAPTGQELVVASFDAVPGIVKFAIGAGIEISRVEPIRHSLEDLYFAVRKERRAQLGEPQPTAVPAADRREEVPA